MRRRTGAAVVATAMLGLAGCATPPPRPFTPTLNTPVPEGETAYAAVDAPARG